MPTSMHGPVNQSVWGHPSSRYYGWNGCLRICWGVGCSFSTTVHLRMSFGKWLQSSLFTTLMCLYIFFSQVYPAAPLGALSQGAQLTKKQTCSWWAHCRLWQLIPFPNELNKKKKKKKKRMSKKVCPGAILPYFKGIIIAFWNVVWAFKIFWSVCFCLVMKNNKEKL